MRSIDKLIPEGPAKIKFDFVTKREAGRHQLLKRQAGRQVSCTSKAVHSRSSKMIVPKLEGLELGGIDRSGPQIAQHEQCDVIRLGRSTGEFIHR